ncbi:MAG: ROK family protein [Gemmataceae bacterium]
MSNDLWIGIDLGGTKILAGLFDDSFTCLARAKEPTPTPAQGPTAVFAAVDRVVTKVLVDAKANRAQIRGMGFGIPGQIDPVNRRVKFAPNLEWHNVDLSALIPADWTWPVTVENDVRAGTYGEWKHGAAKGARHVLGVFAGTGVGGCLILDGKPFYGFNHNAGEIGHIIINWRKGTELEAIAGRRAMMKRAADRLSDSPKRVRKEWKGIDLAKVRSSQLSEFYDKDDPVAVDLIDDAARALGAGIGSVINLISPEVVVLGGGVAGALGESFLERVWEIATRYALPGAASGVRIVPAALQDDSGIVGAAAYARDQAKM